MQDFKQKYMQIINMWLDLKKNIWKRPYEFKI